MNLRQWFVPWCAAIISMGLFYSKPCMGTIRIYGTSGTPTRAWDGVETYLSPATGTGLPIRCENTGSGQWTAVVESPGVYTAAIEDAYGFGPALRNGITLREDTNNRVNVVLSFDYDLLDCGSSTEEMHKEFGQTFTAVGTSITGIVFEGAEGIVITMHESNKMGKQIGRTVTANSYYPYGMLPTIPSRTYYLRFVRTDGLPFRIPICSGNKYREGSAYFDGKEQSDLDLAIRIQHNPAGQILRQKPTRTEVFPNAADSYGQTIIAKGNGLALVSVFPAYGNEPEFTPRIRIRENGPGGKELASVSSRIAVFNPSQVGFVRGQRYYIEVARDEPGSKLRMWVSKGDELEGGELYVNGTPVANQDLAMILVEYDSDLVAPPEPTHPNPVPGIPPVAERFPADGKITIVWDVPESNDIAAARIKRIRHRSKNSGEVVETVQEIPISARGRYQYVCGDLKNGEEYHYTVCTVDASGNESKPIRAFATPRSGVPMGAHLLNSEFTDGTDGLLPLGWYPKLISGCIPTFRVEPLQEGKLISVGWEVPEGKGETDMVIYQRLPCRRGATYRLTAEARQWNPWNNREMVIAALVGIDVKGGINPSAESIAWSQPTFQRGDTWVPLSITARAESDYITIYLRGSSQYSRLMNHRFRSIRLEENP